MCFKVWDKELANIAQTWANQCTFEHDTSRDVRKYKQLFLTYSRSVKH